MTPKQKSIIEVTSSLGEYQIDWQRIAQQVAEAKTMIESTKEPQVKKKSGRKKKGY